MTTEKRKTWNEGKQLWFEYVNLNGYSLYPTSEGIKKLSTFLDLKVDYIENAIYIYVNN